MNRVSLKLSPVAADREGTVGKEDPIELSPDAGPRERAVRLDVEHGQAAAPRLGDDEGAAVGRDDRSVGKGRIVGDHARPAIRGHQHDLGGGEARVIRGMAESKVADVGPPLPVHYQVVAVVRGQFAQIGDLGKALGSRRSGRRSVIETTGSRPSGSQPRPEGCPGWSRYGPLDRPS